jgi:nucleoside-diphosphate-sugar epimerase
VNGEIPELLADEAARLHAMLVHYSTDYVFDGSKGTPYIETDEPHPLGVYGRSKLAGEEAIRSGKADYLILRTSWVYSRNRSSFVTKVLEWSRKQEVMSVVDDQVSNPTWARRLADVTARLLSKEPGFLRERSGLYHVAGNGYASRMDWARKIIELDPNHAPARRGLGYFQLHGKWVMREQAQQRDGYVLYEGRWRTRQEVQLMLNRKSLRASQIEWTKRLKRWRSDVVTGKPHEAQQAHDSLCAIDDPLAIDPLVRLICTERIRELKLFYVRILCRIPDPRAVHQLMYLTLVDRDDDVFDISIREVVSRQQPETVKTYVKALKNADNFCVNRAAQSLQRLNDTSAIGPLIESLVTVHPVRTPPPTTPGGLPAGESTYTFALDDSGKSTPVSERKLPPVIFVQVANQNVLAALVELSGGTSFGFNQEAWRRWNAAMRQQTPTVATSREAP